MIKKMILALLLLCGTTCVATAQLLRAEELETYAKERYGKKWADAADSLGKVLSLDKNNALTFTQVVECPGKTKAQLYVLLNYWFTSTFDDANSTVKLNDKDLGTIIAKGFVAGIANHMGGMNEYFVSIEPVIKCDVKDEKIRVTYTLPYYTVVKMVGGGIMGTLGDKRKNPPVRSDENWPIDKCYPFAEKDQHKKTSCKALVMGHAYSNVVMDKIEECVKHGLTGNEDDNW